jgi:type IV pilus assembly protein PilB
MQENRLKLRLKEDVALSTEDFKLVHALVEEKLMYYDDALLVSEKIQDDYVYPVLSELSGVEFIRKEAVTFTEELRNILPERMLREHCIAPLKKLPGNILEIATSHPLNIYLFDQIYRDFKLRIRARYAERFRIESLLNTTFGDSAALREVLDTFDDEETVSNETASDSLDVMDKVAGALQGEKDAPTVKFVQTLFRQAIRQKASDIHIEPREKKFLIRLRTDGVLREQPSPPKHMQDKIITVLKVMADLNISEKRAPQDGRIRLPFEGRDIDFRVSSLPTIYGEKIVLRILDTSSIVLEFSALGFLKDDEEKLREVIAQPHGIILAAGPTGSGKTTTLYTILKEVATDDKNVTTIEDPVEYRLDKISQCQVLEKAGMTFANGLRAMMRQDPDIIMVGEIRDTETAEIAIQASLTGHLVLSTIHTNSAVGTISRLENMGCDTYLVAATIASVLAQRLIRRLCPSCKEAYMAQPVDLAPMGIRSSKAVKLFRATGCDKCAWSGYKGRIGLHELLVPDDGLRELIGKGATELEMFRHARQKCGLKLLKESGIRKVLAGLTTYEQVLQATV